MERTITFSTPAMIKKYGRTHVINGNTTQELFRGLSCKLGDRFKNEVRAGKYYLFRGKIKGEDYVDTLEVPMNLSDNVTELTVKVATKGNGPVARIVIGVVLIVVGVFTSWAGGAYLIQAGIALALGGVVQLLTPVPKVNSSANQAGSNPSFIFNGTVNVTEQGGPVPVVLGRMRRAGCVVLSAGLTVENLPL